MLSRVSLLAALLALVVAGLGGGAIARAQAEPLLAWVSAAQESPSLRDGLRGRRRGEAPVVARFTTQGGPAFVLDQSGTRPLLRFEGSSEIWVLRPAAGVGGDVYYRNDVGEVVLRATRLGGLTLYTHRTPGGVPCAVEAAARPLRMAEHSPASLFRHILAEAARGARASGRRSLHIEAEADDASAAIIGDAATVAVDAIARTAETEAGRARAASIDRIVVAVGLNVGVSREDSVLRITVSPRLGPAGRPSSARIARAL